MGFLQKAKDTLVGERVPAAFDDKLTWLTRFGRPAIRYTKYSQGWYATIDLNVAAAGTDVEVKSELGHATPNAALNELIQRMTVVIAGGK